MTSRFPIQSRARLWFQRARHSLRNSHVLGFGALLTFHESSRTRQLSGPSCLDFFWLDRSRSALSQAPQISIASRQVYPRTTTLFSTPATARNRLPVSLNPILPRLRVHATAVNQLPLHACQGSNKQPLQLSAEHNAPTLLVLGGCETFLILKDSFI